MKSVFLNDILMQRIKDYSKDILKDLYHEVSTISLWVSYMPSNKHTIYSFGYCFFTKNLETGKLKCVFKINYNAQHIYVINKDKVNIFRRDYDDDQYKKVILIAFSQ